MTGKLFQYYLNNIDVIMKNKKEEEKKKWELIKKLTGKGKKTYNGLQDDQYTGSTDFLKENRIERDETYNFKLTGKEIIFISELVVKEMYEIEDRNSMIDVNMNQMLNVKTKEEKEFLNNLFRKLRFDC